MYKQDLEQTLLDIDEEAELEIGPRDDRPSVVLVGGSAFMLNDVTNRSVTHDGYVKSEVGIGWASSR